MTHPTPGPRRGNAPGPESHHRRGETPGYVAPLAGLATVVAVIAITVATLIQFRGGFTRTVPVTAVSSRAGLVMNPEAKVKMRGVQVGKVASIEPLPDGQAALHLAINPSDLRYIPANVVVDISTPTVFGAKFVQLVPPAQPSAQRLRAGQTLDVQHVTVEMNTVFRQLTTLLGKIEPTKLNQTLGAMATGLRGRGEQFGQTISDFDALLKKLEPSIPALSHNIAVSAEVFTAYGDAAPDLAKITGNVVPLSQTLIDERKDLDAALLSTIGLADVGNDVLSTNRQPLTEVMHLGVPSTDLLNEYHEAITCGIGGLAVFSNQPPARLPGLELLIGFDVGQERYRYPGDLPRVAAKGGPQCTDLPFIPFEGKPPGIVADTGSNPQEYGNQRMVWDSDLIKQWLFGPLDGPPRNSAQVTQPG